MIKKFTSIDEVNNVSAEEVFRPKITVMGIGGAGTNAVNNMINMELSGVKFVVVNTDAQSIERSISSHKIQIGTKITKGLGAGSQPEIGIQAAEESAEDIKEALKGTNMLFITAGLGGGTGTGASQVVSKIAKDMGILTLGFFTKPFHFEGPQRMEIANSGATELEKYLDSLVIVSNQNLFKVINDDTSMVDAFRVTDNILFNSIKSITDLIVSHGLVNLDFNDIKSVIEGMGRAMIGTFEAEGQGRASVVASGSIFNPLLEDETVKGAKKILINITGGNDLTLHEIDEVISLIKKEIDERAFIHFGTVFEEAMNGKIRVSLLATGVEEDMGSSYSSLSDRHSTVSSNMSSASYYEPVRQREKEEPTVKQEAHSSYERKHYDPAPTASPHRSPASSINRSMPENMAPLQESSSYEDIEAPSIKPEDDREMYEESANNIYQNSNEAQHMHHQNEEEPEFQEKNISNLSRLKDNLNNSLEQNSVDEEVNSDSGIKKNNKLFDLIANNGELSMDNAEENRVSISNRNMQENKQDNASKENSFFDLPSFLKRK